MEQIKVNSSYVDKVTNITYTVVSRTNNTIVVVNSNGERMRMTVKEMQSSFETAFNHSQHSGIVSTNKVYAVYCMDMFIESYDTKEEAERKVSNLLRTTKYFKSSDFIIK